jgi:iron(III) transport system ATP-binding protein
MPDIDLAHISKSYVSGQLAVDGLDLRIPDGSFTCLLGPSGCGKTTTLRMIAGLEQPTAGEIRVGDRVLDSVESGVFVPTERRHMGLVFQSYALWPHLTVRKNVEFGLRMQRVSSSERKKRVDEVLSALHIEAVRDRYPAQLSGGQQQRVSLARMLVVNPEVLLLDEPLSNLDAQLRLEMRAELKRIHEQFKSTIVFVTHDQLEAMTLATQIAVMNTGVLEQLGEPMEIYGRPMTRFVADFVGSTPMNIYDVGGDDESGIGVSVHQYVSTRMRDSRPDLLSAVGVRPETVRLVTSPDQVPPGAWSVTGVVQAVLPTGSTWVVRVDCADSSLFAVSFQPVDLAPGTEVTCVADARDLHAFDRSGQRVAAFDEVVRAAQPQGVPA